MKKFNWMDKMTKLAIRRDGRSLQMLDDLCGNKWFNSKVTGTPAVVPQTTITVQQKLQPLHRCNWELFYVYDFMFMHQEHTRSLAL